jgi:hypothetical protein
VGATEGAQESHQGSGYPRSAHPRPQHRVGARATLIRLLVRRWARTGPVFPASRDTPPAPPRSSARTCLRRLGRAGAEVRQRTPGGRHLEDHACFATFVIVRRLRPRSAPPSLRDLGEFGSVCGRNSPRSGNQVRNSSDKNARYGMNTLSYSDRGPRCRLFCPDSETAAPSERHLPGPQASNRAKGA